jgi:hypothetical protein
VRRLSSEIAYEDPRVGTSKTKPKKKKRDVALSASFSTPGKETFFLPRRRLTKSAKKDGSREGQLMPRLAAGLASRYDDRTGYRQELALQRYSAWVHLLRTMDVRTYPSARMPYVRVAGVSTRCVGTDALAIQARRPVLHAINQRVIVCGGPVNCTV